MPALPRGRRDRAQVTPIRVLLVNSHGADTSFGGAERYVAQLESSLPEVGFETAVLSAFPARSGASTSIALHARDWRDDRVRRLRNHAGDVVAHPSRQLERAIASQRPDLVHTNNLPGISTGLWEVCRRLGVPVVHTLHDYQLLCPRVTLLQRDGSPCRPHPLLCGLRRRRLARWSPAVAHVIGVSRSIADMHSSFFPNASIHIVRHPFSSPFARRLHKPSSQLRTIGFIGALDVTKGITVLLEAAAELAGLGCSLRVAGDGVLRERVEAAAARSAAVRYDGVIGGADKEAFFEACDAGIVPSIWAEPGGPPYTVLEWLAAGRPVLISTRGGLGEAVGRHPGVITIEPTTQGIVGKLRALTGEGAWRQAVQAVSTSSTAANDDERWLAEHAQIYRLALR